MAVSYKKLFKILIDRELKKKDLCKMTGISASTISKMAKDEMVSMETVSRICEKLNCTFDDVAEIVPDSTSNSNGFLLMRSDYEKNSIDGRFRSDRCIKNPNTSAY